MPTRSMSRKDQTETLGSADRESTLEVRGHLAGRVHTSHVASYAGPWAGHGEVGRRGGQPPGERAGGRGARGQAEPAGHQNAIAGQITAQVFTYIDVQGLTNQALDALTERGLRPRSPTSCGRSPLRSPTACRAHPHPGRQDRPEPGVRGRLVQANRLAHEELVKALTGEGGGAITVENDTVSINLAAFIQAVKQQLVAAGFTLAERIPQVNASFVLFQSKDITRVRSAFNLLTTLGNWLPVIALLLLALGVYVARDHRRALVAAGLGVAVAMLVLALALAVFRSIYLDAVPSSVLPHDAAAVLYDTIVRFLRAGCGPSSCS